MLRLPCRSSQSGRELPSGETDGCLDQSAFRTNRQQPIKSASFTNALHESVDEAVGLLSVQTRRKVKKLKLKEFKENNINIYIFCTWSAFQTGRKEATWSPSAGSDHRSGGTDCGPTGWRTATGIEPKARRATRGCRAGAELEEPPGAATTPVCSPSEPRSRTSSTGAQVRSAGSSGWVNNKKCLKLNQVYRFSPLNLAWW